ncbi:MAG: Ig-like domain-containing protein [Armatimonadia bacterium]
MFRRILMPCLLCGIVMFGAVAAVAVVTGITTRVSVSTGGAQGNNYSDYWEGTISISPDGRYVAFSSSASNLVAGDTNECADVFVHDRTTRTTTRVSVATGGGQVHGQGYEATGRTSISADGRYVAFECYGSSLVPGDTHWSIFVHDRTTCVTTRVDVTTGGGQGNEGDGQHYAMPPAISGDGRYVAFNSSRQLVADDTNGFEDVYVRDITTNTTTLVSVATDGTHGNSASAFPAISADGRYVAFQSGASNLVAGDTNDTQDIFVRDRTAGTTTRISVATGGAQGSGGQQGSGSPDISADGRYVAFASHATNLVAGDTNGYEDNFVHDRTTGVTTRVSVSTGGAQANYHCFAPAISADGRYVAMYTSATNLVAQTTNGRTHAFVHDRTTSTTSLVSVATGGAEGNDGSLRPVLSGDGRYVAFSSDASNLVAGDTNGRRDIFVRDTLGTNAAPRVPTAVTITPAAPGPETLAGTASGSTDADGDAVTYKYQWAKKKADGTWDAWGYTGNKLAASNVKIGDTWRVRAQAYDGASYSSWKIGSSVTVVSMAGVTPAPKTYNVPVTSCVFVSFRWPVQQATVSTRVQIKLGTTKVVPATMSWVTAERKVKLRPKAPLLPNTYYRVNLDPGITCTSGRVLGWGENYWFKTAPATSTAGVTVAAAPTAGGAELTVNLTSAATVRTVIANIAGRVVAELPERDLPAGVSSLLWNGKSTSGSKVPAGTYLVRVVAIGNEGGQTTAVAPLQIR